MSTTHDTLEATSAESNRAAERPEATSPYLLAIRGRLAATVLEDARAVHNATAGAPANVAAAQSLGDLSHMVYIPVPGLGAEEGEFLILDLWNDLEGLNQFFANPTVQEQAGQIFTERDPVVWMPAPGFVGYHLPAPYGENERIVAIVRGTVASVDQARAIHNALIAGQVNAARRAGDLSHTAYLRLAAPGSPEARELFAVDVWTSAEGMGRYYQDPDFMKGFMQLFAASPSTSVWLHPEGDWVEW